MTKLTKIRKDKGLSQARLAVAVGISPSELSRIENDWIKRIPARTEKRLREVLGVNMTFEELMRPAAISGVAEAETP